MYKEYVHFDATLYSYSTTFVVYCFFLMQQLQYGHDINVLESPV